MSEKSKKIPYSSLVIACIVFSGALYFITACWSGLSRDFVEEGWKVAHGTILNPDIAIEGKKNINRKNEGIEQTINYEYNVDGTSYKSNSVSRELFVNKENYPEGKIVDVYYNSRDVTDSVLVRTPVQKQYLYAMIGFCIIVIGVIILSLIRDFKNA